MRYGTLPRRGSLSCARRHNWTCGFDTFPSSPLEHLVAKSRAQSRPDPFWAFVDENPELAQEIAFQIGFLAGKVAQGASAKAFKRLPPQLGNILPDLAQAALRFLPSFQPLVSRSFL